jgi:Asp-tRNA(Asn)/Glu-tRNA(Gln) amidotransferase A subunit family amidase
MKEARGGGRPNARLIPAVEYLQQQRVRTMMMMELAKATSHVDVYIVANNSTNTGGTGGGRGGGRGDATPGGAGAEVATLEGRGGRGGEPVRRQGPAQRHSTIANLACYPAINVPNGFSEAGTPTNVTFFARPFGEMELLALAKAYQDAAGFHTMRPTKLDT